jgi:hypothetical protein
LLELNVAGIDTLIAAGDRQCLLCIVAGLQSQPLRQSKMNVALESRCRKCNERD